VQNPCYLCAGLWSRSHLKVKTNFENVLNMYLNISETFTGICLKLEIYMAYHKWDMQVKFHNSVLHFDKVYLQSIVDNTSGPLYKVYTNVRIFFKRDSNVQPNCAMCRTHHTLVPALSRTLVGVCIAFLVG